MYAAALRDQGKDEEAGRLQAQSTMDMEAFKTSEDGAAILADGALNNFETNVQPVLMEGEATFVAQDYLAATCAYKKAVALVKEHNVHYLAEIDPNQRAMVDTILHNTMARYAFCSIMRPNPNETASGLSIVEAEVMLQKVVAYRSRTMGEAHITTAEAKGSMATCLIVKASAIFAGNLPGGNLKHRENMDAGLALAREVMPSLKAAKKRIASMLQLMIESL